MRWRITRQDEQKARGCRYCAHSKDGGGWWCPFDECPYHELDSYVKYQDFMKATGATVPQIIKRLKGS